MVWGAETREATDIAADIAKLQKQELDRFLRDRIWNRDLHRVVANLNEAALSKDNPNSEVARNALAKLGFTD